MRSCAERVAATNDASSMRASTDTRSGPSERAGTRHAISHPDRNRRALIVLAQPDLAAMPNAALDENRLAMKRMPGIVNDYFFSVVGRM